MKSSVPLPCSRSALARSKDLRSSATPEKIADNCSNSNLVSLASKRAIVVLPQPGGPHRMRLERRPLFNMRVKRAVGPDEMILAGDLGELLRPQPVGQWPRRRFFET